jgi:hypothetical protein
MKKNVLGILVLLVSITIPVLAQGQRMSPDDQDRFNGYYGRWVQDKQMDNRDDMLSMEHRMQDLMSKYGIASNTPYDEIASPGAIETTTAPTTGVMRDPGRDRCLLMTRTSSTKNTRSG